ncbi:hypothetical protein EK21DRAFT_115169 [Setomelanomma holmii]|uniref:Uncharacterized protein n=1 Tax=Setomelanomma holmii TaxID=210430 RepID=A0A9P4LIY4_9PLEO|nr:hypothetical protein EK21DRAFT_115169 [Setomelanomma holmii]
MGPFKLLGLFAATVVASTHYSEAPPPSYAPSSSALSSPVTPKIDTTTVIKAPATTELVSIVTTFPSASDTGVMSVESSSASILPPSPSASGSILPHPIESSVSGSPSVSASLTTILTRTLTNTTIVPAPVSTTELPGNATSVVVVTSTAPSSGNATGTLTVTKSSGHASATSSASVSATTSAGPQNEGGRLKVGVSGVLAAGLVGLIGLFA